MPGSIEKRGVNSWRIMISDGYRPDGTKRRIYKTLKYSPSMSESAQRKECEKELALLYAQAREGRLFPAANIRCPNLRSCGCGITSPPRGFPP